MKLLYIVTIFFCLPLRAFSSDAKEVQSPVVDQRVELLSIVFRLAGNKEYNAEDNLDYVNAIHRHFDKFISHPLITYAKDLRDSSGVSYDAVMFMAIHLKFPPVLTPIIPFVDGVPNGRWKAKDAARFAILLRQFYKDADCVGFFQSQSSRYALAEARFRVLFERLDASWYDKFYGRSSNDRFNIIIGLGNGGGNYGPHLSVPGQKRSVYAIMGSDTFDSAGAPTFEAASYLSTLIHEFNHSFINPLSDQYEKQLSESGQAIFQKKGPSMRRLAYGEWKTMYNEALVRAAVVIYLKDHADTIAADREVKAQQASGFIWMPQLVTLLEVYQKERKTYPTLASFMPRLVEFYDQAQLNLDHYEDEYLAHCAKVISTNPFRNGEMDVNPTISTVQFNFDKPLDGIRYFIGPGKMGKEHYPEVLKFTFADDNKSLIMHVKLQPNTVYQVGITGSRMRTRDGYSVQNYSLDFKTGVTR
jgi:hypothetical protein